MMTMTITMTKFVMLIIIIMITIMIMMTALTAHEERLNSEDTGFMQRDPNRRVTSHN